MACWETLKRRGLSGRVEMGRRESSAERQALVMQPRPLLAPAAGHVCLEDLAFS